MELWSLVRFGVGAIVLSTVRGFRHYPAILGLEAGMVRVSSTEFGKEVGRLGWGDEALFAVRGWCGPARDVVNVFWGAFLSSNIPELPPER